MALKVPVEFEAEYRGQRPAGSFTNKTSGEVVSFGPSLKFEIEDDNGDVSVLPVSAGQLDKCEPAFDHALLKKGDQLVLRGHVILQDRGSDRDSFLSLTSVAYAGTDVKPLKAAASA